MSDAVKPYTREELDSVPAPVHRILSLLATMPPGREHTTVPVDDMRLLRAWIDRVLATALAGLADRDRLEHLRRQVHTLVTVPDIDIRYSYRKLCEKERRFVGDETDSDSMRRALLLAAISRPQRSGHEAKE